MGIAAAHNNRPAEVKSERIGLAITPTELGALEFVFRAHGKKYEGAANVLRDYSISDAVAFHQRALEAARATA